MNKSIHIIVAYSMNHAIGKDNQLLWHLADDMAFFKKKTSQQIVIMGKNTYLSIPSKYRPLPNRINIVISSQPAVEQRENLQWAKSPEEALNLCMMYENKDIYIIGGGQIYQSFMQLTDVIYATEVDVEIEADTFFPKLVPTEWESEEIARYEKNEKNEYSFRIIQYNRLD